MKKNGRERKIREIPNKKSNGKSRTKKKPTFIRKLFKMLSVW